MVISATSPFIFDWVFLHAERTPEAPAIATPTIRLSYGSLADRIRALAGQLSADGVEPGDRILVALPNSPAAIVASLAVQLLGGTAVEVNRRWGADVLAGIVARSGVRRAFVWGRDAATWRAAVTGIPIERLWVVHPRPVFPTERDTFGDLPVAVLTEDGTCGPPQRPVPLGPTPELEPDRPALVLYTSGSTSRPHGVVQTHRNIEANTRSIVQYLGLTAEDRSLITLPLYYCYGRSVLQTHLFAGGSVFIDNRFAFPRVVLETLASELCTGFAGVSLTYDILRRQVDVASITFPRLRYLTQAGGPMAPDTIDWVREAFRPAVLFVMYGQTEATARLSYLPPERAVDKGGSIGIAIPGVELRVVDENGHELRTGEVGELVARGDNVTPGYLDEPAETAAILHDGWLWTGDLAYRDPDGFFFHRGRAKGILKIGGHRVSPVEIEQVIERHPQVAEAAVVGVDDDLMGQVPVAYIVGQSGETPLEADLSRFCRAHLPAYQVPVTFVLVDALPRNEAGKVLRSELAAAGIAGREPRQGERQPIRD